MAGTSLKSIAILVLVILCLLWQTSGFKRERQRHGKSRRKPNIIFIMTDDQDTELGSMDVMNKTREIFKGGTQFVNAFVTSPICCPSRSSILTGMYAHNHNVLTNNVNCSSLSWRRGPEKRNFARYVAEAGYQTGYFGKYLNAYDGSYIPYGWHRWAGLIRNSRFYNYVLRHNTFYKKHQNNYENDYFTNVITDHAISFFKNSKARKPDRPIMMVVSHSAPHGPEDGAPQYQDHFPNATAPRTPNWNFTSPDKHWIVRVTPPMTQQKSDFSDMLQRKRLQTLLSVDDNIQRIWDMLKETGYDRDTYIFFSSDHGYHLGQYGLVKGKSMPYESDIRVPFFVRGPGIPTDSKMHEMVLNIDLAPTFLDIAGVRPPKTMDGTSIMRLFRRSRPGKSEKARRRRKDTQPWRDTFLIERGKIRIQKTKTPSQFIIPKSSLHKDVDETKPGQRMSKAAVLERFCSEPANQLPCKPDQKWHCIKVNNLPRLRKCKKVGQTSGYYGSPPTTSPAREMCTCYRPRVTSVGPYDNIDDMPYGDDATQYLYLNQVDKTRHRRSIRDQRKPLSLKQRRLMRELARMIKQQKRRERSKMLSRGSSSVPTTPPLPVVLDSKLQRLNKRIAGVRQRLESLRGRKRKLQRMREEQETVRHFKERYEEFPCPCPEPSARSRPKRSQKRRGQKIWRLRAGVLQAAEMKKKRQKAQSLAERKKIKKEKKKSNPRRSKCSVPGLSCFYQTNYHWKVPPLWTGGEFCFCPSSNNNTYWCLRTINATHNFLYCEFITQFLEYFDLTLDPYQLYNIVDRISPIMLYDLHNQLEEMRKCKGAESCTHYHGKPRSSSASVQAPLLGATPSVEPTEQSRVVETTTALFTNDMTTEATQEPTDALTTVPLYEATPTVANMEKNEHDGNSSDYGNSEVTEQEHDEDASSEENDDKPTRKTKLDKAQRKLNKRLRQKKKNKNVANGEENERKVKGDNKGLKKLKKKRKGGKNQKMPNEDADSKNIASNSLTKQLEP
ncbi:extracellular sulfatase Sulf-1 isoform X2 [Nematostella vectensis]|nr:extracellular sulfatase Sulf-1 isoform X2 [Nematostella vectensis]XP_032229758.2 extracellular sulfatase Sulf-1 isoform X2 [Nematostella vectensis]XP_048589869.1 extracellular sulfatase Sulf-1 isoform X2 [Nematostella vectensis]